MRRSGRMGPTLAMLSVEPQWCGTLLSLCGRHDADAIALALSGPPLDPDWIAFAGSFGFEICSLSSTWALIFDAVKASGVILLLGVGSLVCYKLYNFYWPGFGFSFSFRSRLASSESSSSPSPSSDSNSRLYVAYSSPDDDVLVDEFDDDDSVQGCYFGPSGPHEPSENADKSESSVTTDDGCQCEKHCPLHHKNVNARKTSQNVKPQSTSWLFQKLSNVISCHVKSQKERKPLRPSQLLTSYKKNRTVKYTNQKDLSKHKHSRIVGDTFMKNVDTSQLNYCVRPWSDDNYSEELITSDQPRLLRDESYDSLGFPKGMASDASLDSVSSEISFDFSLPEMSIETSTMVRLEDLQQVINQIKHNCDNMSNDFESIKSNRNLPGMSSLMRANLESYDFQQGSLESVPEEQKEENARACFAGLYSLTVINNSTSSDMSDSCLNLDNRQGSFGSAESFEWDYPKLIESPITEQKETLCAAADTYFMTPEEKNSTLILSEPEFVNNLEWDDMPQYSEENGNTVETKTYFGNEDILGTHAVPNINRKDIQSQDQSTEADSAMDSSLTTSSIKDIQSINSYEAETIGSNSFTSMTIDSILSPSLKDVDQNGLSSTFWQLDESGYVDWEMAPDSIDDVELDQYTNEAKPMTLGSSSVSELSTPLTEGSYSELASPASSDNANNIPTIKNVGERVDIIKYANQEWRGDTIKAANMLKGYFEIPKSMNLHYLRQIRGDNYCGVRATIVQLLTQGLPLPSGSRTYESLFQLASSPGYSWIQDWTFAGRLSYQGNSVLFGMQTCLNCLENLSNHLSSKINGREEAVVDLLNCNPSLDLHVLEAVKLHMLLQATELYEASVKGDDIPLFALLMFSRDTSASPKAFMKNHLCPVGDSGGLEQIEMFLLGHTLSVALKVIRPSAFGTEEFTCYFSESDSVTLPEVILIAEDDRHYNILLH